MAHRQPSPQNVNDLSAQTAAPLDDANTVHRDLAPDTTGDSTRALLEYEANISADRLVNRLKAQERLAAALIAEADRCTSHAAHLVDTGCAALPKTVDDPVLRERILQDILRYRQAPMRRRDYHPFSGKRTVCPRCWVMDGRRCTGPIDPTGQFYACLGCGPTKKITHLHKLQNSDG